MKSCVSTDLRYSGCEAVSQSHLSIGDRGLLYGELSVKLIHNSSGKIFYGIHFYPGVAQYQDDPSQEPYRVFLNEDTLRAMDPTFAGKPIFVEHVDDVTPDLNQLRKEA